MNKNTLKKVKAVKFCKNCNLLSMSYKKAKLTYVKNKPWCCKYSKYAKKAVGECKLNNLKTKENKLCRLVEMYGCPICKDKDSASYHVAVDFGKKKGTLSVFCYKCKKFYPTEEFYFEDHIKPSRRTKNATNNKETSATKS